MRRRAGAINYAVAGTFDNLNPFIVQGSARTRRVDLLFGNHVFDTLMQRTADEPFTLYPLLAESGRHGRGRAASPSSRSIPRAKFSDGQPVTPDDVIFTSSSARQGPAALQRHG